jgi:hypothetical protein
MDNVNIAGVETSRFILGSNPFSGFSHQGVDRDRDMVRWYTVQRIKETLCQAEELGITTLLARTGSHIMRMLLEYRDEGGKLQWFAQLIPDEGPLENHVRRAHAMNARACHIHGGVMDHLVAQGRTDEVRPVIDLIRELGMIAGIAGHNVRVFEWAEEHLDCDYYMCCYYNPTRRDERPEHVHGALEKYRPEDRDAMVKFIATASRPVIHYKVLASGRNDPAEAFAFAASHMRENDAVCVGVYRGDDTEMLRKDVKWFERSLAGTASS